MSVKLYVAPNSNTKFWNNVQISESDELNEKNRPNTIEEDLIYSNDWYTIWIIPAAIAGVVAILYFLTFKNEKIETQG